MEDKDFSYVYTAPTEEERREIASIRRQYEKSEPKPESKLSRLRSLNARVQNVAKIWGLTVGIVGCLIFGLGFSMVLEWALLAWGVAVALFGGVGMGVAYPLYRWSLRRNKKRYGEEILRLSEELLHE